MRNMPKFSIIMPVYNAEDYLHISLNSIFKQTISDFEVIAINDGSKDGSLKILEQYAKDTGKVRVINQINAGPGQARNVGIKDAKGKYIAFLDADDYWSEDFLEAVLEASDNETADYIYIEMVKETIQGKIIARSNVCKNVGISKEQMICRQITGKMPWGMSKVIKRELVERINTRFQNLTVGEENIFSYELLKASSKVAFVNKVIYHYVQNENGQHNKGNLDPWRPLVVSFKEYLVKKNEYEHYESTINSLALKALSICIYRTAIEYPFLSARKRIDKTVKQYFSEYNFSTINKDALDNFSIIILYLIKNKMFSSLIILSRYRRLKQR